MKMIHLKRVTRALSILCIVAGLAIATPLVYFQLKNRPSAAATTVPTTVLPDTPSLVTGHPVGIDIPSLNINLKVIDGFYNRDNGKWTLTLDKAQFATPSVQPNNLTGNTLIYGHYRRAVFAYLHLIKPGAKAYVTTANGYRFSYTFKRSQNFDPTDTSIFAYKGKPRLSVQTCSGAFFQHRTMYYFTYDGYAKES